MTVVWFVLEISQSQELILSSVTLKEIQRVHLSSSCDAPLARGRHKFDYFTRHSNCDSVSSWPVGLWKLYYGTPLMNSIDPLICCLPGVKREKQSSFLRMLSLHDFVMLTFMTLKYGSRSAIWRLNLAFRIMDGFYQYGRLGLTRFFIYNWKRINTRTDFRNHQIDHWRILNTYCEKKVRKKIE